MKKRQLVLFALAIALVLCSTIGTSFAYFTTYVTAKGGYVIQASPTITEPVIDKAKNITITNSAGASPIFVRVKVLCGEEFVSALTVEGDGWSEGSDQYYYYGTPLNGGESTTVLLAKIGDLPERIKDSEDFNIIVVYESVLAVYDSQGNADISTSWANGNIKIG